MNFSEAVLSCVQEATEDNLEDINQAIKVSLAAIKKLPNYNKIVEDLIYQAVQDLVYDRRHQMNRIIKNQRGDYDRPAKQKLGDSKLVEETYRSVYDYCIAGRTLGMIYGEELNDIASSEEGIAEGHQFNASLCRRLRSLVKDGQRVKEVVSEKKLDNLFKTMRGKMKPVA